MGGPCKSGKKSSKLCIITTKTENLNSKKERLSSKEENLDLVAILNRQKVENKLLDIILEILNNKETELKIDGKYDIDKMAKVATLTTQMQSVKNLKLI